MTGYDVYRNGTKMATVATTSSPQTSLQCGTSYAFAVVAVDAAGNRSPQAQMSASTSACSTAAPTLQGVDGGASYYGSFASPLPTDPAWFPIGTWGSYNTTQANRDSDAAAGLNTYVWLADPCGLGTQVNGDSRFRVIYEESENRSCVGSATSGWLVGDEIDMCCGPPNYAGGNGYNMLTQRNASLPADGRLRYTNYGKGVMFWETDAQAAQFVNLPFLSLVSNDIYWFTDPNERGRTGYRWPRATATRSRGCATSTDSTVSASRSGTSSRRAGRSPSPPRRAGARSPARVQGGGVALADSRGARDHLLPALVRRAVPGRPSHDPLQLRGHARCRVGGQRAGQVDRPALNGPTLTSGFAATGAVRASARWDGSNFYVLAGSAGNAGAQGQFSIPCVGNATATVLGEGRSLAVSGGSFQDSFADGLAVHIYRIDGGSRCGLT